MTEKEYAAPWGKIRYWTDGSRGNAGPALVFLPGLTADHRLFEKQLQAFAGKVPLLVWDPPGHGLSWPFALRFSLADEAAWLADILQKEGLKKPVLVGQSMGGYVAQALMEQFPGTLGGFISIDSAPLQRQYLSSAELWLLKRTEPLYRYYPWKALVRAGSEGCAVSPYGRRLMRQMMEVYSGDQERYARLAGHGFRIIAQAVEKDLPYQVDCPALLLCGEQDRAGAAKRYNRRWHERSGIPLIWIPQAGHNANADQPDLVNSLISQFLSESGRPDGHTPF